MEETTREEVMEQLEAKAEEESTEMQSYYGDLPEEPELEGGFDLKSAGIGAAIVGGIVLVTKVGPKAAGWVKRHLPNRKKQGDPDEMYEEDDYDDAEPEETDKKKK